MARRRTPGRDEANGSLGDTRLTGVTSALAAVATAELVAGILPGPRSVLAALADAIIDATPAAVVRWAIAWLGAANRAALLVAMTVVVALIGALAGTWYARSRLGPRLLFVAIAAAAGFVLAADALIAPLTAIAAPLAGAIVGIVVLDRLEMLRPRAEPDVDTSTDEFGSELATSPTAGLRSRRTFLTAVTGSIGAAAVAVVAGHRLMARQAGALVRDHIALPRPLAPLPPPAAATMHDVDGLAPILTPTSDFFRIDARLNPLRLDAADHVVRIRGMVDHPFDLTYDELLELAVVEADVTLCCVSNEVGGPLIGTARWQGVPLTDILDRAGVQPGADQIVGRAVDTWTAGFPVEAAYDGRTALLAVGMNGEPLPARHGFPVRLVVEGLYGYVCNTKWLAEIELTTFADYRAYWIRLGWAPQGPIKVQSRIDVPSHQQPVAIGPVDVAGVAWSDELGISGVEVRVDDGRWEAADVTEPLANGTWRQWRYRWQATEGRHRIQVRAIDAHGDPQTDVLRPPEPDGATGHHTISVVAS